jgi:transposase
MHGGRTLRKHSEVFVAFDVAKKKHAVTVAEAGRSGEVRFLGDVENSPLPIERTIKRLADRYDRLGRRDTGFIARSKRSATSAWWSLRP